MSSNENSRGRFHVVVSEQHAVVLDTETGQAWLRFLGKDSGIDDSKFGAPKVRD